MLIGKIIGHVWATRKNENLSGCKLMIVEPIAYRSHEKRYPIVAVDSIGGGIGETVLVVSGSSARVSMKNGSAPIDHVIVGIVDKLELDGEADSQDGEANGQA
jgi:ethanolamine utilization protein EutN